MTDIATEIVLPEERKDIEKEDCDKDSGNQSGEEAEMENGVEDPTCGNNVDCEMEKQGSHCHIDKPAQGSGSRRNSIAEEIKSKIASVSRRNSIGSRRSSGAASRRGSIQSIKEDPTCEEVCTESKEGPHCHVEKIEDPSCVEEKACPESKEGAHCHVEKIEDPTCAKDTKCLESNEGPHCHVEKIDDPTCKKERDCAETKQGSHCHVERAVSDDDDDVISENSQNIEESQKKQSLRNSPEKVVNKATTVDLTERSVAPSPAETHSNESTPLTARKVIQTPANMKENEATIQEAEIPVPSTMPPSKPKSPTKEPATNGMSDHNSPVKEREGLKSSKGRKPLKSESEGQPKVQSRAQSKSRPSSPSDENRRSRYSSKERKSSEKIHHEMPDVSTVKSKLDDKNPDYKPPTSQRKIETRKLVWKAESKVENKNMDYRRKSMGISQEDGIDKKPKKIENHKLDWKAEAKTVTRNTAYTPPAKSEKKVESHKINWKAESKINSRENINYQPGGVGSISPTRSANNVRRARSRSSHGNSRAISNGNGALGASQENVVNGVRLTASAAPYIARRSSRPREKVNGVEVNGQKEG
eukprot:TRINITY_DN10798_c0_g1_i1.p1 TRINITY_DN10798_c0_g1~~TRINITY_DN10798_c0_g1_i1.p1  ORF type:complete len:587 (-),score=154.73 TRINITY_DN10798_c0_g1_i1:437-2197(-)